MMGPDERPYESLLSKYVSVWLWSVLFGSMSGVSYTFIGYRPFESRFRPSIVLSALLFCIGCIAALYSLIALYRALVDFLVPRFVLNEESNPKIFALCLHRAFFMFIVAVVARVVLALIDAVLASVGPF
jgi:hypothetical protein